MNRLKAVVTCCAIILSTLLLLTRKSYADVLAPELTGPETLFFPIVVVLFIVALCACIWIFWNKNNKLDK